MSELESEDSESDDSVESETFSTVRISIEQRHVEDCTWERVGIVAVVVAGAEVLVVLGVGVRVVQQQPPAPGEEGDQVHLTVTVAQLAEVAWRDAF